MTHSHRPTAGGCSMTPTVHWCTACSRPAETHPTACHEDGCAGHWPALCCPGCSCGSYEAAHPTTEGTTTDA
jgi:hypothetical protein